VPKQAVDAVLDAASRVLPSAPTGPLLGMLLAVNKVMLLTCMFLTCVGIKWNTSNDKVSIAASARITGRAAVTRDRQFAGPTQLYISWIPVPMLPTHPYRSVA
jgi:hypothetical protein